MDWEIKSLATFLSNGEVISNIKLLKTAVGWLSQLSRSLGRKVKGTASYQAAKTEGRFHLQVANISKDYLHKLTTWLAKSFDALCLYNLNVKGMIKNHNLALPIDDLGVFKLTRHLKEDKCKLYGSRLAIISRWYPSYSKYCSNCGHQEDLSLADRVEKCEKCGYIPIRFT